MRDLLEGIERVAALAPLIEAGWSETADGKGIARTFRFKGFPQALGWMVAVGTEAQKMDHHPEWKNVFRTVEVVLTTHSAGGVTELDVKLAGVMEAMAG